MTFPAKLMLLVISIVITATFSDSDHASVHDHLGAIKRPLRSYLPPAAESDANSAATLRNVLQRTTAINNALEQSDNILFLDADSYDDHSDRDDRFETLFNSHAHDEQRFTFRDGAQMEALLAATTDRPTMTTIASTTTRRVIEGLPDASEDYVMIEGSSVADGEKINPNLIKTLLG